MPDTNTPADLRAEAARWEREAYESFERCDTDGALSQWSSGLTAQKLRMEAALLEQGGQSDFPALFTVAGDWQPAVVIEGKWGPRWMLLDTDGDRTGEYLPFYPARRDTLAKRGFVEGRAVWPAKIIYSSGRGGLVTTRPITVKAVPHHVPPLEILTRDRWADATK
jgi:hypothetical protein